VPLRLHWTFAYWLALLLVTCAQVGWWLHFLVFAATRSKGPPLRAIRDALRMSSWDYARRMWSEDDGAAELEPEEVGPFHNQMVSRAREQRQEALILGALGLAAWAAVAAASAGVAKDLNDASLRLLFVGVVATLTGPVLFSSPGTRTTYMGLQSLVAIGFDAIVLWLAYAVAVIFGPGWHALGIMVAAFVVVRESLELAHRFRQDGVLFRHAAPALPEAPLPPAPGTS
jgi:hypothetical protein